MYYKIEFHFNSGEGFSSDYIDSNRLRRKLKSIRESHNYRLDIFIEEIIGNYAFILVYLPFDYIHRISIDSIVDAIRFDNMSLVFETLIEEISMREYLHLSRRVYYETDTKIDSVLRFKFEYLFDKYPYQMIDEYIINKTDDNSDKTLNEAFIGESFKSEIYNIRSKPTLNTFVGHPVHYIIETISESLKNQYLMLLISELVRKNRLVSRKTVSISLDNIVESPESWVGYFEEAKGGVIIISLDSRRPKQHIDQVKKYISEFLPLFEIYRHSVLIIFDVTCYKNIDDLFLQNINQTIKLQHIKEEMIDLNQSIKYIQENLCKYGLNINIENLKSNLIEPVRYDDLQTTLNNLVDELLIQLDLDY